MVGMRRDPRHGFNASAAAASIRTVITPYARGSGPFGAERPATARLIIWATAGAVLIGTTRICGCAALVDVLGNLADLVQRRQAAQFSTLRPFTRVSSRSLLVTRISFSAMACAAIHRSLGPMGVPARSSATRTTP